MDAISILLQYVGFRITDEDPISELPLRFMLFIESDFKMMYLCLLIGSRILYFCLNNCLPFHFGTKTSIFKWTNYIMTE